MLDCDRSEHIFEPEIPDQNDQLSGLVIAGSITDAVGVGLLSTPASGSVRCRAEAGPSHGREIGGCDEACASMFHAD